MEGENPSPQASGGTPAATHSPPAPGASPAGQGSPTAGSPADWHSPPGTGAHEPGPHAPGSPCGCPAGAHSPPSRATVPGAHPVSGAGFSLAGSPHAESRMATTATPRAGGRLVSPSTLVMRPAYTGAAGGHQRAAQHQSSSGDGGDRINAARACSTALESAPAMEMRSSWSRAFVETTGSPAPTVIDHSRMLIAGAPQNCAYAGL